MNSEFADLTFPERHSGPLAITHVTVIPMDTERRLPDHTVVITDGMIRTLGPAGSVATSGMRTIDGSGRYLMPGLADMHTHYRDPAESILYLAHGITTVRLVLGSPFQLALARLAERAGFPSPHVIVTSPSIDGVGPTGRTDLGGIPLTDPAQAEGLVRAFAERGYRQIKAVSLLTLECLRALGRAAASVGLRLVGTCPNAMTHEEAIEAGMTCFDQLHLIARGHMRKDAPAPEFWDRFDPVPGTRLDLEAVRRLANRLAEREVWNVPTLVFHQRTSQPVDASMSDPAFRYVPQTTIRDWESTIVRFGRRARLEPEPWRELARERAVAFLRVVEVFHQEGAPLMTGTDSLNPYNVQGASLHQELANFVTVGMRPYGALRCATAEPARFMGESETWGTIAIGRRADLVLLDADPLQGLSALGTVQAVFVNGYYLPRAELDRLLDERARMVAAPPKLPSTDLPAAPKDARVGSEGTYLERIIRTEFGRLRYRHSRPAGGGWLIEETHTGATPRRHIERRSVSLELSDGLELRSGEQRIGSFVGEELTRIDRDAQGYVFRYRAVDGWESEATLPGEALVPSERLAMSVPPLLCARLGDQTTATVRALSVVDGQPSTADIELARVPSEAKDPRSETRWRLKVDRPTQATEQIYRLSADGRFLGLEEMMPMLWPRELVPSDADQAASQG